MTDLQLRKQALLIESELHRATLQLELARLEASVAWIDHALNFARQARPLLLTVGVGAGLLLARGLTGARPGGGSFARLLRWGQSAYVLWKSYSAWRNRRVE